MESIINEMATSLSSTVIANMSILLFVVSCATIVLVEIMFIAACGYLLEAFKKFILGNSTEIKVKENKSNISSKIKSIFYR